MLIERTQTLDEAPPAPSAMPTHASCLPWPGWAPGKPLPAVFGAEILDRLLLRLALRSTQTTLKVVKPFALDSAAGGLREAESDRPQS